jgi:hypothetical protein
VSDEWVIVNDIGINTLEGCMEIGDAVLGKESDKIEPTDWVFTLRWWK